MVSLGRHDRQARLDGLGADGQARVGRSKVLVVGLGGLGSPAAMALAGAGVGQLTLVDPDRVEMTNLHRQLHYTVADIGQPKAEVLARRVHALDPTLRVKPVVGALAPNNVTELLRGHDLVVDGMDDLAAKLTLADACRRAAIPLLHGSAAGWEGIALLLDPPRTPCYKCAFPDPQPGPACADVGVLGPMVNQVGLVLAQEAVKHLAGLGSSLRGKLLLVDGRDATTRTIDLKTRPGCECTVSQPGLPVAATTASSTKPVAAPTTGSAGENGPSCPMPWNAPQVTAISCAQLRDQMDQVFLLDVREQDEFDDFHLPKTTLIPLGQLGRRVQELPKDRTIVVYCAVGGRSARATEYLRSLGYPAVNLSGGMRTWLMG